MFELYDDETIWKKSLLFERWEGREEGKAEGLAEGLTKGKAEVAKTLYTMGMSLDKIAQAVGYPIATVKSWLEPMPV